MQRQQVRLRKEYLHKRSLESTLEATQDKKRRLKAALDDNKPIPSDLRSSERHLRKDLDLQDDSTLTKSHLDDEYINLGFQEPKILLTTSRDPSSRLTQFLKELRFVFPNAQRVNRGAYVMKDLLDLARSNDVSDVVILHEHRGKPDGLIISHMPQGPTAYFGLSDVVLRHDLAEKPPNMSEVKPHLVFDGFSGKIGKRTMTILQALFPPAAPLAQRVVSFVNSTDIVQFRNHTYEQHKQTVDLTEQGPRFNMRLYRIELGTLDMPDVKVEWALRPFMNKQKAALSAPDDDEEEIEKVQKSDKQPHKKKQRTK